MKKLIINLVFTFVILTISAQDKIKVMSYNLLNYGNTTSYCTSSNNNVTSKEGYLKTIISYYQPDIFGAVEISPASNTATNILNNVMNINGINYYKKANNSNLSGSDLISMVYYNSQKLTLYKQTVVSTLTRDILIYSFYYKGNLTLARDTFHCIVAHLKAGSLTEDQTDRSTQTQNVMNYIQSQLPSGNFVIMGDFNIQSSAEDSYQKLTNPANSAYKFIDPINKPGIWNNSSSFASIHTQSTHNSSNGCAASGGMDDRFDFILLSQSIMNGNKGISYQVNSYKALGNDGNHYNQDINSGSNSSVPSNVLSALYEMSDHLPVTLTLNFDTLPTGILQNYQMDENISIINPIERNQLEIYFTFEEKTPLTIELLDLSGRVLLKTEQNVIKEKIEIPFDVLGKGLYFVRFTNMDNMTITKKILKI